jgi:protocatechuate 3,4-dioxygenase, alpha subunit
MMLPTPAQTVGPYFGMCLPFPGGPLAAPLTHPRAIWLQGYVLDGAGDPVPDALVELWQPGLDGTVPQVTGSLRRDPVTGGFYGRQATDFTGFARVPTDADGRWAACTLRPGAVPGAGCKGSAPYNSAPYISVCLFARGLLRHLFTRVHFPENAALNATDPLLSAVPRDRRHTLIATAGPEGTYRFDLVLQGTAETVFLALAD